MGVDTRCAIRPETGREFEDWPKAGGDPRHVVVIGGGPGGMESTRRLRELGHKVTLIEARERLGGTLRFAALAYEANERLLNWLTREVEESGADIRLSTQATPALLASLAPDAVIVATGAVRGMPDIPGNEHDHVLSGDDLRGMMFGETSDAIKRKTSLFTRVATKVGAATGATANLDLVRKATHAWMPLGDRVVIIGGELVGLELAEFLTERGRKVTVVDDQPGFGRGLSVLRRMRLIPELEEHGVRLVQGARDIAIGKQAVTWANAEGEAQQAACDTVIVAKGATGDTSLADAIRAAGHEVQVIGDANGVSYIEGAMWGAAEAVRQIARERVEAS
jgi:NADPH-dependent 2,4-dienoyl-CoA reductase/sulfur reductase-like enzyme